MTFNQLAHRAYLESDLWKSIRQRAIAHYGSKCNACGSHGTDVHHRTYARVGGKELLSDLEILCRDCHEARHSAWRGARKSRKPNKTPCLSIVVAYRYLTPGQKIKISQQFNMNTIELFLHYKQHDVMTAIGNMLGVNIFELHLERQAKSNRARKHERAEAKRMLARFGH